MHDKTREKMLPEKIWFQASLLTAYSLYNETACGMLLLTDHYRVEDLYQVLLFSHLAVPYCLVPLAGIYNCRTNEITIRHS
jgi:hypothetical protein